MASTFDTYQTSLTGRYCSPQMATLFGQRSRHSTWRKLWLYLAQSEQALGVKEIITDDLLKEERKRVEQGESSPESLARLEKQQATSGVRELITDEMLEQMEEHLTVTDKDFELASEEEKRRRHDVMAHVHTFGLAAPAAKGIVHYGATSCYVTDNAELILMRDALDLLIPKLAKVLHNLKIFSLKWKSLPTLSFTHLQPAQISTVGKRAAGWAQDLMIDLAEFERVRKELKFRGAQGTTGTQASFLEIFRIGQRHKELNKALEEGDTEEYQRLSQLVVDDAHSKCDQLNELLCEKAGFDECYDISTQTYTRKVDCLVANAVTGLGTTVSKIASDLRHLANMQEVGEPREDDQIGSSAMAYKQNPMRAERISSLARVLQGKAANFNNTHSAQWLERSLDDSAIRRIDIPEMFLIADGILLTLQNVTDVKKGLKVFEAKIESNIKAELPFMITENIMMKLTSMGADRQIAHEEIRVLSKQAVDQVRNGAENNLIELIKKREFFKPVWRDLDGMMKSTLYIGRSAQLVDKFCGPGGKLDKKLAPYKTVIEESKAVELKV